MKGVLKWQITKNVQTKIKLSEDLERKSPLCIGKSAAELNGTFCVAFKPLAATHGTIKASREWDGEADAVGFKVRHFSLKQGKHYPVHG